MDLQNLHEESSQNSENEVEWSIKNIDNLSYLFIFAFVKLHHTVEFLLIFEECMKNGIAFVTGFLKTSLLKGIFIIYFPLRVLELYCIEQLFLGL